jgi:hypothetical protein
MKTFDQWVDEAGLTGAGDIALRLARLAWSRGQQSGVKTALEAIAGTSWRDSPFSGYLLPSDVYLVTDRMNKALEGTGYYLRVTDRCLAVTARVDTKDLAVKVFEAQ